jgi:hypothetical protein
MRASLCAFEPDCLSQLWMWLSARPLVSESNERFDVLSDPVEDLGKAEFVPVHRAGDERVSVRPSTSM